MPDNHQSDAAAEEIGFKQGQQQQMQLLHQWEEASLKARHALRDLMTRVQENAGDAALAEARKNTRQAMTEAAILWLEAKWGSDHPCTYCGNVSWTVGTPLDDFLVDRGGISSTFQVACDNCGNTVSVNAFTARLLPLTQEIEEWE